MLKRSKRKHKIGVVVSAKNNKTRLVLVERIYRHSLYGKTLRRKRKFAVHDANNISKLGDKVKIMECRPISKTKRWTLVEILSLSK